MITNFTEALQWINSRLKFGIKPGLERMKLMLKELGNPEQHLKVIHVAGTNGKGSTVSYIRQILQEAGYTVGTFTSPYIETFNERISINGSPISDEEFVMIVNKVKPAVEKVEKMEYGSPTEFEILTVLAFEYFANVAKLDLSIIEAGLGGRLDSTNVVAPILSIITNIGHDHMNILGDTIEEIANEKAGIIKNGVPVISAVEQKEAIEVIADNASKQLATLSLLGKEFTYASVGQVNELETFTFQSALAKRDDLQISMKGEHQIKNAATAVMAVDLLQQLYSFHIEENAFRQGLLQTMWIGRFEKMSDSPLVYIDGAHNPEGISTLTQSIERYFSDKKIRIIFCAMQDKSLQEMITQLDSIAEKITFTQFEFPRCAKARDLYEISASSDKHYQEDWEIAVATEVAETKQDEVLIITGSLYFISVVRARLTK